MPMYTETVCDTLEKLDPVEAIRAIHFAYLQLSQIDKNCDVAPYDNGPVLKQLSDCLVAAGHPGFPVAA